MSIAIIIFRKVPFLRRALIVFSRMETALAKAWVRSAFKRQFFAQWSFSTSPEFFDHEIDLFYSWSQRRSSHWVERGVFGSLALRQGGSVLELACGDGFNAKHFYSLNSTQVVACDFDPHAISLAKSKHSTTNVSFVLADIRTQMPSGDFDTVIWDAAIEHFTPTEIDQILLQIKKRLEHTHGVLSGQTIVERQEGKSLEQHEYEFKGINDLSGFLAKAFKNVRVFETIHPDRRNLYFWASDSAIPFDESWSHSSLTKKI